MTEDWLDSLASSPGDPWHTWIRTLGFPRQHGPLDAEVEHAAENAILEADARRLAVSRTLPDIWQDFRKHHVELDGRGKYRRMRYRIWRAAALKTLLACLYYQDDADIVQIGGKLVATYRDLGLEPDGGIGRYSYSIWRPTSRNSYLETYAADVLALFEVVMPRSRR
jgi:hypothetical protein